MSHITDLFKSTKIFNLIILSIITVINLGASNCNDMKQSLRYEIIPLEKEICFQLVIYGGEATPLIISIYKDGFIKSIVGISQRDVQDKKIIEAKILKKEIIKHNIEGGKTLIEHVSNEISKKIASEDNRKICMLINKLETLDYNIDEINSKNHEQYVKIIFKTNKNFARIIWFTLLAINDSNPKKVYNLERKDLLGNNPLIYDEVLAYLYCYLVKLSPIKPESIQSDYLYNNDLVKKYNNSLDKYLKGLQASVSDLDIKH